ncbi:MAG: ATP synthase F1 subunit gamma [Bacillales bacterium]|jgi:F-type H+-transporting ATPase subunit gamma|nr:ATP synthase F1 subunit gamma [Bacillales bacterium]
MSVKRVNLITRIKAINANQKITNAMELIANVKLKKERAIYDSNQAFAKDIYQLMYLVLTEHPDKKNHYSLNTNPNSTLFIVVTSNFGLCGAYNENAIEFAKDKIRKTDKVIVIGHKGINAFEDLGYDVVLKIEDDKSGYERDEATSIAKLAISLFDKNVVGSVRFVYTAFINQYTYELTSIPLLPLTLKDSGVDYIPNGILLFEPDEDSILNYLIPLYFETTIYSHLIESHVSEQSTRRLAMQKATDNAQDIKDNLQIEYNKIRQTTITQEIIEIVSGMKEGIYD